MQEKRGNERKIKEKCKSYRLEKKIYTVPCHIQHDCLQWIYQRNTRGNKSSKVARYKVQGQYTKTNCISIPAMYNWKLNLKIALFIIGLRYMKSLSKNVIKYGQDLCGKIRNTNYLKKSWKI